MGDKIEEQEDATTKLSNVAINFDKNKLVQLVQELQTSTPADNRITPKRRITRPNHTDEHIISEADLEKLENCGESRLFSWAIFCFGGALSLASQAISIISKWWGTTQSSPVKISLLDNTNILIFLVCLFVGIVFYSAAPNPGKSLKKIIGEIRKRPSVDSE